MLDSTLEDASERSRELARWLVEAGRRRRLRGGAGYRPDPAGRRPERKHAWLPRLLLYGVLAAACVQYFYVDAMLQVVSLPSLIVFALNGTGG